MDYEKLAAAIKLCGSTPKVDQCTQCPYWASGDMNNCIPRVTADAATAITDLLTRAEAAEDRAEKAERERDAAYEAIKELIEEEDLPVAICREICENHDGMCCERAQIGIWDTCRGFKPRGQKGE